MEALYRDMVCLYFTLGSYFGVAQGRWKTPKPAMYGIEKSDQGIVVRKAANKGESLRRYWIGGHDQGEVGSSYHIPCA